MNSIDLHRSELFLIVYHKSSQDICAFFSFRYPFFFHIIGQTLLSDPRIRFDKLPQNTVTREKEIHVNPTSSLFTLHITISLHHIRSRAADSYHIPNLSGGALWNLEFCLKSDVFRPLSGCFNLGAIPRC